METTVLHHRALRAQASPLSILRAACDPQRLLGVVDGLVSVTQRAWGLVPARLHAVH